VRELEPEYEGRINFVFVSPEETQARKCELDEYELGSHGLVAFDENGEVAAHVPGHEFGKQEILEAIQAVLPED
jgi:hypothetical protein